VIALVGASIGAPHQKSALVLVRRTEILLHDHDPAQNWDAAAGRWKTPTTYDVVAIERPPPGTTLPALADRLNLEAGEDRHVVVDCTRAGLSFAGLLRGRNVRPVLLTDAPRRRRIMVPRLDLFGRLHVALAEERVDLGAGGEALARALEGFVPDVEGDQDEVVTALGCALWLGEIISSQVHQPPPPRPEIRPGVAKPPTFDQVLVRGQRRVERERSRI
jgi:hypothetical protein